MNIRIYAYFLIAIAITAVIAISVLFATVFEYKTSCLSVQESSENVSLRIAGGDDAKPGEYPYAVSLQHQRNHICGGALIGLKYVLTAAHCVFGFEVADIEVVVGTNKLPGSIRHMIYEATLHPDYNDDTLHADVAVIQLKKDIRPKAREVLTIALPESGYDSPDLNLYFGRKLDISGFGATRSQGSLSQTLKKLTTSVCRCPYFMRWGGRFCSINGYGSGICQGDDGSPVIIKNQKIVIGIVSTHVGARCAVGSEDVHTNVDYYVDWVRSVMREK